MREKCPLFREAPNGFCGSGGVLVSLRQRILVSPKILLLSGPKTKN
jgi:hypothetical protein